MVESLGSVVLKSGEQVSATAVRGPDDAWRGRITALLGHKGEPWLWQNSELLSRAAGIDAWFYVLHRDGQPIAHQMTAELQGVGIFGHVWTEPADRGQGAASELMRLQMAHFRRRNGRALYLSTRFASTPYRLYQKHGFVGLDPLSGYMTWTAAPLADFEADYFAPGATAVEALGWPHWPTAPALFMSATPGLVRCAPLKLFGRKSSEGALLPWIQGRSLRNEPDQVFTLVKPNGAVVGLAAWTQDEFSPDTLCVDVFCQAAFWSQGEALLRQALKSAPARKCIAYADSLCPPKAAVLTRLGFALVTAWPRRLAGDAENLLMFERRG